MNPCKHIGKLTFESNDQTKNAYALNDINQYVSNNTNKIEISTRGNL